MKPLITSLFGCLLLAQSLFAADSTNEWNRAGALLKTLQENFSTIRTVQTGFTEAKTLKIFDRTVTLEGRLALEASGRLAWRVDTPVQYVLVLKDNAAFQWDEEARTVQQLPFSGNPVFETVITQIQQWFSGRFAELEPDYNLEVLSENPPRLVFIPRTGRMVAKAIRRVTVSIREDQRYVEQIVIEDVSGDLTTISFHDTILNEPIAPSAWEVVPREP